MFDLKLEFDIDGKPTKTTEDSIQELGEDFKAFHLQFARESLEAEINQGFPKDFRIRVDGKVDADPQTIKPFGKIEFINTTIDVGKLIMQAYDEIMARSPVGGSKEYFPNVKYKDWNWILLNDNVVARNRLQARRFADNFGAIAKGRDRLTFINVVPYARKLERYGITTSTRGKSKGQLLGKGRKVTKRTFVERPNGTYAGAQRVIRTLFTGRGKVSLVKYIPFAISVEGMRSHFVSTGKGANQKPGRPYLYPVIDVIIDTRGFKGITQ